MKELLVITVLIYFATSCGLGVKVKGLDELKNAKIKIEAPEKISLEPDYKEMAKFCDDKYLPDEFSADECFRDLTRYYKLDFGPNFDSIINYCKRTYDIELEQKLCEEELFKFMEFDK